MIKKNIIILLFINLVLSDLVFAQNSDPVIENVMVQQQEETFLVDINYTVTDANNDTLIVYVLVSNDSGKTFTIPAKTFAGDYGFNIIPGVNLKQITWDAGLDYPEQFGESFRVKLVASDLKLGQIVLIPAETFTMGDNSGPFDRQPRHDVYLDNYEISPFEVTNAEYKIFCEMADHPYPPEGGNNQPFQGYFVNNPNYPVVAVSWYDAVRYCNWLSTQYGYAVCYDTTNWSFDPSKNGYHLPTEAQWERATRGELEIMKYPWGDEEPGNRCNYDSLQGLLIEDMAEFLNGRGTLPIGKFQPNGLALYDMAGNVWEWCNDWFQDDYYEVSPGANPYGPNTGTSKVLRGGAWSADKFQLECSTRHKSDRSKKSYDIGFRIAR